MNTHHKLKNFQERNTIQALLEALHWGALRSRLDMRGDILGKPVEYKYHGKFNDSMPQTADLRVSPKAQMKRDFTEADQFLCLPATVNYFCPSKHNIFRGSHAPDPRSLLGKKDLSWSKEQGSQREADGSHDAVFTLPLSYHIGQEDGQLNASW